MPTETPTPEQIAAALSDLYWTMSGVNDELRGGVDPLDAAGGLTDAIARHPWLADWAWAEVIAEVIERRNTTRDSALADDVV